MISFTLILILSLSSALRVDIANSPAGPMDPFRLQARADYIECLTQKIIYGYDQLRTVSIGVEQEAPSANVSALYAEMFALKKDGTKIDPPNFSLIASRGSDIVLDSCYDLDQLVERYGCYDLPETSTHYGKKCDFTMNYAATELGVTLATLDFTLTVRQYKLAVGVYTISATKIYKKLCDCEIINKYAIEVDAYIDTDCEIPLEGNTLTYGSLICLKVTSPDALASRYQFVPTSVLMNYTNAMGDLLSVEMIPLATVESGIGYAEIAMDVLITGDHVSYFVTIVLGDGSLTPVDPVDDDENDQGETPNDEDDPIGSGDNTDPEVNPGEGDEENPNEGKDPDEETNPNGEESNPNENENLNEGGNTDGGENDEDDDIVRFK